MNINPNLKSGWKGSDKIKTVDYYFQGIINQNRYILSEAISLVESTINRYDPITKELLERCYQLKTKTWRIGITGSPGVGKSSFIEKIGTYIIEEQQKRVAVLAVDPSSSLTHGSILGDKTRMPELAKSELSFIRPSPSRNCLGGVSSATKEIMCLCEAAGYEVIIVETVGVGQSETMVSDIVDMFVLMLLPGAGDEIQGIKRGIVEMADIVIVNKSDGDRIPLSKIIQQNYINALHFFQTKEHEQMVPVLRCSSLEGFGIEKIWSQISEYFNAISDSQYLIENRQNQEVKWFESRILLAMEHMILKQNKYEIKVNGIIKEIKNSQISPFKASAKFDDILWQMNIK